MASLGFEMAMLTSAGLRRMVLASSRIFGGSVAENMIVCRSLGMYETIFMMSSEKPMSSMRSASSRMRYSTCERSTPLFCKWAIMRPGVAITTSEPLSMPFFWMSQPLPSPPP